MANPTVDGNNNALSPQRSKQILGEYHDDVMSIMRSHVLSRGGPSPAREKINSAARNLEDFRDVLRGISQSEADSMKMAIAMRPGITPPIEEILSNDEHGLVRQFLASNPDTTRETMMKLAVDPAQYVRRAVAQNSNVAAEVLDFMSQNEKDVPVLVLIARSRRAGPEALDRMIRAKNEEIEMWAAGNPRTPTDSLMFAARRGTTNVRRSVAQNRGADATVLSYLAHDPEEEVRNAVIMNQSTPPELAQQIKSGGGMSRLRQLIRRMI
jgi:hypothetical protein